MRVLLNIHHYNEYSTQYFAGQAWNSPSDPHRIHCGVYHSPGQEVHPQKLRLLDVDMPHPRGTKRGTRGPAWGMPASSRSPTSTAPIWIKGRKPQELKINIYGRWAEVRSCLGRGSQTAGRSGRSERIGEEISVSPSRTASGSCTIYLTKTSSPS